MARMTTEIALLALGESVTLTGGQAKVLFMPNTETGLGLLLSHCFSRQLARFVSISDT